MRSVVLGAGGFGREVLPALTANDVRVVAVVDSDPATAAEAAGSCSPAPSEVFVADDDAWWETDTQLVVDCTPPGYHLRHAEAAFRAGKDVLVAKPMALTLADASRMARLARLSGRCLAAIQQMRYLPAFLRLRDLIGAGELGRLGVVTITFNVDGTFWKPGLAWRLTMDQPVLLEGSVHVFDLVRWVTGDEPASVVAHAFNPPWSEFRGSAALTVCATLRTGTVVRYLANWAPRGSAVVPLNSGWELEFDQGLVRVVDEGLWVNDTALLRPPSEPMSLVELNTRLVRWYVGHLDGGERPGPTGADNVQTMAFVDAVLRSATDGVRVSV
jgi:predicted dehydrogenase